MLEKICEGAMSHNMTDLENIAQVLAELPENGRSERPSLFSISGFTHYEEVLSNWYAFFMDPNGPHQLGTLFLDTLLRLAPVDLKRSVSTGSSMVVRREFSTPQGSAIDLVIHDGEETKDKTIAASNAIIIENKVYHHLANPLHEYWNAIEAPAAHKVGVILCLKSILVPDKNFVPITHRDLINAVVSQLPVTTPIPEPYRQYLIDLHQNIHELTAHMEYSKEVDLYLNHAAQIQRALGLEETLRAYLRSQLEVVAGKLDVQLGSRAYDYWYLRNSDDRAYYTILLDDVLKNGNTLGIVVELHGKPAKNLNDFATYAGNPHSTGQYAPIEFRRGSNWIQYTKINIPMSEGRSGNLGEVILQRIQRDLAPILSKAKEFMGVPSA